ncbi:mechanosensitive ion channel family protein [Candidatus Woesearchaeota archaeon]|nr:mechanosensitive ion channel family protein [Candidatus Woesearchaeota archaeon]MBW3005871.1 mechanosensitive ion channel family protein [Candidatus Woesearchaeota archaeon]
MDILADARMYLGPAVNNIITAIIILLIGFIIAKLVGRLIQRILHEAELDNLLKKAGAKVSFELALAHIAEYFVYFITIIFALNQLGITTFVLYVLAIGAITILIISVFLGLRDFIPNFMAGWYIYRRDLIKEKQNVKINGVSGRVVKLSLLDTRIKTKKGDLIYMPNSVVIKSKIIKKK